jgi:hypothetical protein
MAGKADIIGDALRAAMRALSEQDAARLSRTGSDPAKFLPYTSNYRRTETSFYDPQYWSVTQDHLEYPEGTIVGTKDKLVPIEPTRRLEEVLKADPELMYRGMSAEELANFLRSSEIKSNGSYNMSGQEGLTYFTSDPDSAQYYANSFAPEGHKPNMERPAYVVAAKRPPSENIIHVPGVADHEIGVNRATPVDDVVNIYRGTTTDFYPGLKEKGLYVAPRASLNWEGKSLEDVLKGRAEGGSVREGYAGKGAVVDPYADEVASGKALMAEKQYDDQPWSEWAGDAVGNALNTAKAILPTALGGRGEVGISDMARGAYEAGKDAVTFPGDVLMGKQALFDESGRPLEQAVGRSFNTVGTVGGASSLVPVPDNSLRVFGGTKSRTADKNALTKAQIMESQAAERDAIWRQAGWGRGAEGRWRYEIPDVGTTVDPAKFQLDLSTATIPSGMKTTLSEYINHPELFAAYPEFKNMVVKGYYGDPSDSVNGYYMPRSNRGTINPGFNEPYIALNLNNVRTPDQQRSTLLHEIQHAVQQKEGFVPGSNSLNFAPDTIPNPDINIYEDALVHNPAMKEMNATIGSPDWKDAINKSNEFYEKVYKQKFNEIEELEDKTGKDLGPQYRVLSDQYEAEIDKLYPIFARVKELKKELENSGIPVARPYRNFLSPFEAYYRTAGEVEARNVQNRKDWTLEQLKNASPARTQEYINDAQYIDWNNTSWRKGYAGRGRVVGDVVDQALKLVMGSSEKTIPKIIGTDAAGRPMLDFRGAVVSHFTDPESAADIFSHGYRQVGDGYYGRAVSFTPNREYGRQFGGVETNAIVSQDANILNSGDPAHSEIIQGVLNDRSLAPVNPRPGQKTWDQKFRELGYDGLYDPGAGDLFIYNSSKVKPIVPKKSNGGRTGYGAGGEVDEDVTDALRIAKDVGGATTPQVFMTDANGVQYDATGKIVPPVEGSGKSNSAAQAVPATPTPQEVGRRAAEDPATFDAMMERYAVPDRDIVDYEALKEQVSQQPQPVQQMTHVGAPPMRDIKVDMPLFGGEYNVGQAPYNIANPMSGVAQTAYDLKTVPLYFTPMTAPIGAGMDVAEGIATGDPLTASLAIGFGPGGKMAKAAGIGSANYFIDPSEAEAGPARWFSKAMEVASALPMEKMTGQQALAMLRKGTSPEELKWTGTEAFLSSRPQVSKSELVDYLNNNRVNLKQVTLGGSGKPTRLQDVSTSQIPEEILSKYRKGVNDAIELKVKYLAEAKSLLAPDNTVPYGNYAEYKSLMGKATQAGEVVDQLGAQMRQEYVDSIGGLGVASKFGPDSDHRETLTTPGGKNYQENLYQVPQRDIFTPFVDQMRKDVWAENYKEAIANGFSEDRAKAFADKFNNLKPGELAKFLGKEEELASVFESQRSLKEGSYTGGHWGEYPDVIAHTRTNELLYEPPGANRPYRVHNVEETQSDPGQAGRKRGFKDPQAMAAVVRLRQETQDLKAKLKSEQARLYSEHQERIAPYVEERVRYERELRDKYKRGEISLGDMNRAAEEYGSPEPELTGQYRAATYETLNPIMDKIAANEAEIDRIGSKIGSIPMMPYVTSTEAWTDLAIKKELDKALDSGSDYFSWTPGEAHVERYDLSRHIGKIQYNPDDGSFLAYDPKGRMVVNESINDPSEMEEYVGKELAEKILAEEKSRRYSIEDAYSVDKDEDTGRWMVSVNGETAYDEIGSPLDFDSKGEAKDYVNQMMADDFSNYPVTLEGLDIKTGGEGMIGYYDKIYLKRVQEVLKKATGTKPEIEVIEVQTSAGPRKQLGIRLTDEMREKARFSDFNRGGTVTGPHSYGSDDPAVGRAIALTREY